MLNIEIREQEIRFASVWFNQGRDTDKVVVIMNRDDKVLCNPPGVSQRGT